MALVSEATDTGGREEADPEPSGSEPVSEAAPGRIDRSLAALRSRRRIVVILAFGALLIIAVYGFYAAFVTNLWYQSRQRSMEAQSQTGTSAVAPKTGDWTGILQVQTPFALNVAITQGDGPAQLRSGPGHRPGTPLPGALGNSVVYGRAKQWGGPFKTLKQAQPGTQMYLKTRAGAFLGYRVVSLQTVSAAGVERFLGPSNDYRLTLVTDAGGRFSDKRLVVVAVSGTVGKERPPRHHVDPGPSSPGLLQSWLPAFLGWLVATVIVVLLMRRRHRPTVVVAAATPLILVTLLCGFLTLDLLWSPLA